VDAFAATRLAVGAAFLAFAAVSDLRTRKVRDPVWVALGSIGLFLVAAETVLRPIDPLAWPLIAAAGIWFYAIFFGDPLFDENGFHARPVRIALLLVAAALFLFPAASASAGGPGLSAAVGEIYSLPAMVLVYQGFYRVRLLHGGADTKGLIALTLLVPSAPSAAPFPLLAVAPPVDAALRIVFPFSLVVWVDAALASLAIPIGMLVYNAMRGDLRLPQAFLGYRVSLEPFAEHAWLMERITPGGEHVLVLFPKRGADPSADIARLRAAGIERAWVTPQTPFMVPLFVGFLMAFLVGNLLIGILGLAR